MYPRWGTSRDELFYVSNDNRLMQAALRDKGDGVEVAGVRFLFAMPPFLEGYDVARDGRRIVINRFLELHRSTPLTVIANWTEGLQKR